MKFFDIRLKIVDRYIIRKFIGSYFFILILAICIIVVFDISERIGKLTENNAPLDAIIFDYYINFIPFFVNQFSPLFVFITVIFFTSRMAYNTEIVAILASGISFKRMMYPYFVSALFIAILSLTLNLFIIPPANEERQAFENVYLKRPFYNTQENIHLQLQPNEFVYMSSYNTLSKSANRFSLERYEGNKLVSKLMSDRAVWDSTTNKWRMYNYFIRDMHEDGETHTKGGVLDTAILLTDFDLSSRDNVVQSMDYFELNDYISRLEMRGSKAVQTAYIERYTRISMPFSTFILTLIGVSLSSRKIRGGIGLQIGIGIGLSFAYIFFMQFSTILVDSLGALLAVWIPNIIFAFIALYLYRMAPK